MSKRYPGGIITKNPATPTGPYDTGAAPGIWTLDQQLQYQQQGVWPTAGLQPNYIEDVFSTYLYTGTGANQTITNGIDLSTKGGLVWIKPRSFADNHSLFDTARGALNRLRSNDTTANVVQVHGLNAFNTTGFSITGANGETNQNTITYVSWTFREQPKFFDVVTYTGTGSNTTIAHSLGAVPGSIIVKRTDTTAAWAVYHRSLANTQYLVLNTTAAAATGATWWNSTTPTSTVFSLGTDASVNASGGTYVAYLFAHDAGGFGLAGTDNVISCGSFTTDPSTGAATVSLGYEPQWLLVKASTMTQGWHLIDNMRGMVNVGTYGDAAFLEPNTSDAESTGANCYPTANGFYYGRSGSTTYIYIAIRRGPMKVPTLGTNVFGLSARSGTGANATVTGGQTDDAVLVKNRGSAVASLFSSRLTGTGYLVTSSTAAEVAAGATILQASPWDVMDGVKVGTTSTITNASANTYINYLFKRAPSFFDVVCYTGTGSATTQTHNLGVAPELLIIKDRTNAQVAGGWNTWTTGFVIGASNNEYVALNTTNAKQDKNSSEFWNSSYPTASVFGIGNSIFVNESGSNYVAYLFATCAGVSKVGSYTGNGTTQTIDCGLTAGARFVLIKRTDSTGDWYVYDTARGMTVLTDPYLLLNTTAAEVATLGSVTTVSTGFALNSAILAAINVSAGTYIFLAIA